MLHMNLVFKLESVHCDRNMTGPFRDNIFFGCICIYGLIFNLIYLSVKF